MKNFIVSYLLFLSSMSFVCADTELDDNPDYNYLVDTQFGIMDCDLGSCVRRTPGVVLDTFEKDEAVGFQLKREVSLEKYLSAESWQDFLAKWYYIEAVFAVINMSTYELKAALRRMQTEWIALQETDIVKKSKIRSGEHYYVFSQIHTYLEYMDDEITKLLVEDFNREGYIGELMTYVTFFYSYFNDYLTLLRYAMENSVGKDNILSSA